jgi:hypothetical protein
VRKARLLRKNFADWDTRHIRVILSLALVDARSGIYRGTHWRYLTGVETLEIIFAHKTAKVTSFTDVGT